MGWGGVGWGGVGWLGVGWGRVGGGGELHKCQTWFQILLKMPAAHVHVYACTFMHHSLLHKAKVVSCISTTKRKDKWTF